MVLIIKIIFKSKVASFCLKDENYIFAYQKTEYDSILLE